MPCTACPRGTHSGDLLKTFRIYVLRLFLSRCILFTYEREDWLSTQMVLHWHNPCKGGESYHWAELWAFDTNAWCRFTILVSRPFPAGAHSGDNALLLIPGPIIRYLLFGGNKVDITATSLFITVADCDWLRCWILIYILLSRWCYPCMIPMSLLLESWSLTLSSRVFTSGFYHIPNCSELPSS